MKTITIKDVEHEVSEEVFDLIHRLYDRDEWLNCLEAAGVDNWQGMDLAYEIRDGE